MSEQPPSIPVDQAFNNDDSEQRQAQHEFDEYLESRPYQDENGAVHHPETGGFINSDEYFEDQRDAAQADHETKYEDMSMSDLARKLGRAEHYGDKTMENDVHEVLHGKIARQYRKTKSHRDVEHNEQRMNNLVGRVTAVKDQELEKLKADDSAEEYVPDWAKEDPSKAKEWQDWQAEHAEPEPQQSPEANQQPENGPDENWDAVVFGRVPAGLRRVAKEYSVYGTEFRLSRGEKEATAPTLIRTMKDEHGASNFYFAPKGLFGGAIVDVNATMDQERLVYVTPPDSHVDEEGRLVGDGPGYTYTEPYPPMTMGEPWRIGDTVIDPIDAVQVSEGFINANTGVPVEQQRGPDTMTELIKAIHDFQREQGQADENAPTQTMPTIPTPESADGAGRQGNWATEKLRDALAVVSVVKDRMTDQTMQMAERVRAAAGRKGEKFGDFVATAHYLGDIAMAEVAYRAGNAADSAAYMAEEATRAATSKTDFAGQVMLDRLAAYGSKATGRAKERLGRRRSVKENYGLDENDVERILYGRNRNGSPAEKDESDSDD